MKLRNKSGIGVLGNSAFDFILFITVMALVVFGVIMVFSSSYYDALDKQGDAFYYLKRDVVYSIIGFALLIFASLFPYRAYRIWSPFILVVSLALLIIVFTSVGTELNNAARWIDLGFMTIMPGEIAKVAAIIIVAAYLSKDATRIKSFKRGILPMLALIVVFCGLIALQPNLSTAITVAVIIIGIMFVAGMNLFYIAGLLGGGVAAVLVFMTSNADGYWLKRVTSFLDPFADPKGDGWQVIQSLLALGSGGLFGVGLGKSIQKTLYLPEPQNDFIFAIIGEELGFIGCMLLIIAFIIVVWRGAHTAINAPDLFGTLLASGITIMVAVQVVLNIAVVTSSMPPTGVSLPFISWGGNSLMLFMYAMGILLNISKKSQRG